MFEEWRDSCYGTVRHARQFHPREAARVPHYRWEITEIVKAAYFSHCCNYDFVTLEASVILG